MRLGKIFTESHFSSYNLPYEKVGKNEPVCIADEVPFDIPDSWEWARLKDLTTKEIKRGKSPKYADKGSVYVFAQKCNVKFGGIDISLAKFLDMRTFEKYPDEEYMINEDIIINSTGNGTLGRIGMFHDTDRINDFVIVPDSHVTLIRSCDQLKKDYLFYTLKYYQPYLEKLGEGSTNQTELRPSTVAELFIPIPPIEEQERIVEKLLEVLPMVDMYGEKEKLLQAYNTDFPTQLKKSILQEAVQDKLVPQDKNDEPASVLLERIRAEKQALIKAGKIKKDKNESVIFRRDNSHYEKRGAEVVCIDDEIPFEIPDSWEWVRFDSATIYTTDYVANGSFASLRENVKSYKTPNYAIMVKTQDFANNFTRDLTYTDEAGFNFLKKSELFGGELMLSNIGASIGKVFIIPKMDKPMTLAPNSIVVKCIDNVTTRYLQYLMLSFYGQEMLKGFTAGTAMPKFSKTQLRNSLIPLPPHKLQERIVAKLDELFLKVDAL